MRLRTGRLNPVDPSFNLIDLTACPNVLGTRPDTFWKLYETAP
jgi:hypothetical protein